MGIFYFFPQYFLAKEQQLHPPQIEGKKCCMCIKHTGFGPDLLPLKQAFWGSFNIRDALCLHFFMISKMCLTKVNAGSNGALRQFFFSELSQAVVEKSPGSAPFGGEAFALCMQEVFFFYAINLCQRSLSPLLPPMKM